MAEVPNRPRGVVPKNPPVNVQRQMMSGNNAGTGGVASSSKRTDEKPQTASKMDDARNNRGHTQAQKVKTKKKGLKVFCIILILTVVATGVYFLFINPINKPEPVVVEPTPTPIPEIDYTNSGYEALTKYLDALHSLDPYAIDDCVGFTDADSYIAHEFAFANGVAEREAFVRKVCSVCDFTYATTPPRAEGMSPDASLYNDGEELTVTIPDYTAITAHIVEARTALENRCVELGYSTGDVAFRYEMLGVMLEFINAMDELPTTTVQIIPTFEHEMPADSLDLVGGVPQATNTLRLSSDADLDDLLFGSPALHEMSDTFAKIVSNYQPVIEGMKDNPDYLEWKALLDSYIENGELDKYAFIQEFEVDEDGKEVKDAEGNPVLIREYYVLTGDEGESIEAPDEQIPFREEIEFVQEGVITYNWCGSHFVQTQYDGVYGNVVNLGDGTVSNPAGVGTPVLTKVYDTISKSYVDVEVALINYWSAGDAIVYIENLSKKNHGLTLDSKLGLFVSEFTVKNLSGETIHCCSDLMLSDAIGNKASRTGTLFGFTSELDIEPNQTVTMNDWCASATLDVKYLAWGGSFNRKYDVVYFAVLAGTPEVPSYSPYGLCLKNSLLRGATFENVE